MAGVSCSGSTTGDDVAAVAAADDGEGIFLRIGEWDAAGALRSAQSVELERATWQHDIGVTAEHVVFIESPTTRAGGGAGGGERRAVRMGARGRRLVGRGAAGR